MKKTTLVAILGGMLLSFQAMADHFNGSWSGHGHVVNAEGTVECPEVKVDIADADGTVTITKHAVCGEGEGQVVHDKTCTLTVKDGVLRNEAGEAVGVMTQKTIHITHMDQEHSMRVTMVRNGPHLKVEATKRQESNVTHFHAFLTEPTQEEPTP